MRCSSAIVAPVPPGSLPLAASSTCKPAPTQQKQCLQNQRGPERAPHSGPSRPVLVSRRVVPLRSPGIFSPVVSLRRRHAVRFEYLLARSLVLRMLGSTQCTTLVSRMLDGATLRHEIACHNDHATSGARTIVTVCARSATALLSMDSAESANSARNLSSTCP